MLKLASTCAAALALAAASGTAAIGQPDVIAPPRLTVTLPAHTPQRPAETLFAGPRTLVVRNGSTMARDFQLLRIPGGTDSLVRFEGSLFLPETTVVVRRFGRIAPGKQARAVVRLARGDYVVAALSAGVVTASHDLRVT